MKPLYKNSLPRRAKIPFEDIPSLPEVFLTDNMQGSRET